MAWYQWQGDTLLIRIRVQTRASRDELGPVENDHLKVRISAPPIDGKANRHLLKFLGREFKIAPSRIRLISGETSRQKRLALPSPGELAAGVLPRKTL